MTDTPDAGHPDLDSLAELDEGLVDEAAEPAIRAHLDACASCRAQLARLRTTRALVSTLPAVPMPPDVAARIDTALAGAAQEPVASTTVVPLAGRPRWRNAPTLAGAAAAAAVILLVAAVVTGRVSHNSDKSEGTSSAPTSNAAGAGSAVALKEWRTGNNYTPASLATLVPKLVTGTPPAASGMALGGSATGSGGVGAAPGQHSPVQSYSSSAVPAPTAAKSVQDRATAALDYSALAASQTAVLQCARILNGGPPVTPVAVDFARFAGKPAVVIVLPTLGHPESLDVWVVRTVCSASSFDLYWRRIPRPVS